MTIPPDKRIPLDRRETVGGDLPGRLPSRDGRRRLSWLFVLFAIWLAAATVSLAGSAERPGEGDEAAETGELKPSLLELLMKGGPIMIPIGICSIVAFAVALERLISLRRSRILPPDFMEGLIKAFGPGGTNVEAALQYCERSPSPLANVIRSGVQKLGRRLEIVEKAVEDVAAREVARMRRGLETLAVVGTISPLLGLLGTIYGMIRAFRQAAVMGLGRAENLATGIYEALVTTAAGLTVAVPTLLIYYYFVGRVERVAEEIEQAANEFLDQCYEEPGETPEERPTGQGIV
jgi:biopolymer transport protein ExbB